MQTSLAQVPEEGAALGRGRRQREQKTMQTSFGYRSYAVSHDGSAFCAQSQDGEPLQFRSKNLLRLTRAIDTMWNALEGTIAAPSWLFGESDIVDIDAAAEAMLVINRSSKVSSFPLEPTFGLPARAAA
jgi:hypothetical protein